MSGKEIMFTPIKLGSIELRNRLVMAPLTRMRAIEGDVPNPLAKTYYEQRASAGLIISEATQISPLGKGYPATPGIYSAEQTAAWKEIVSAVHAKGGKMVAQLWHVGRISHSSLHPEQGLPEAPSAIAPAGQTSRLPGNAPRPLPGTPLRGPHLRNCVATSLHPSRKPC